MAYGEWKRRQFLRKYRWHILAVATVAVIFCEPYVRAYFPVAADLYRKYTQPTPPDNQPTKSAATETPPAPQPNGRSGTSNLDALLRMDGPPPSASPITERELAAALDKELDKYAGKFGMAMLVTDFGGEFKDNSPPLPSDENAGRPVRSLTVTRSRRTFSQSAGAKVTITIGSFNDPLSQPELEGAWQRGVRFGTRLFVNVDGKIDCKSLYKVVRAGLSANSPDMRPTHVARDRNSDQKLGELFREACETKQPKWSPPQDLVYPSRLDGDTLQLTRTVAWNVYLVNSFEGWLWGAR